MHRVRSILTLICAVAIAWQPVLHAADTTNATGVYHAIEEQHLKAFQLEKGNQWSESSFYKFVVRYFGEQKNPTPRKKRELAFNILKSDDASSPNSVLDQSSWEDLNLFYHKSGAAHCLAEIINYATTEVGRVTLYRMLAEPSADIGELKKNQAFVRELIENEQLFAALSRAIEQVKRNENLVLAFWDIDAFKESSRGLFFDIPGTRSLNNYEYALALKTLTDHGQRLTFLATNVAAATVLPTYTLSKILNLSLGNTFEAIFHKMMTLSGPFSAYGSVTKNPWLQGSISIGAATCCALWAMGIWDWQVGSMALCKVLGARMKQTGTYVGALQNVGSCAAKNKVFKALPAVEKLQQFFQPTTAHPLPVQRLLTLLTSNAIKNEALGSSGKMLVAFRLMNENKDQLVPAIAALGEIDAYLAIAKLYKKFKEKKVHFTFAQFLDADRPYIKLTNFWNPFISPEKVIPNNIELGGQQRNNMIVTGPNAGGKSTTLKGIAISLILAQTFGIVPAQEAIITPFTKIASYLNITDDIVAGHSLFKAEVLRAHNLIETIEKLGPKQFSFVILDEIFNGTSHREGAAAAYGTAKHLGTFDRSITILATHFPVLTHLEAATNTFTNYRVRVNKMGDGTLYYPFTIELGVSDQNIALDMLRLEGFKSEILQEAENILKAQLVCT